MFKMVYLFEHLMCLIKVFGLLVFQMSINLLWVVLEIIINYGKLKIENVLEYLKDIMIIRLYLFVYQSNKD
jgi:hypothetical protein